MSKTDDLNSCFHHTWDTSGAVCTECGFNLYDKNITNVIGAWDEYGDDNIDIFIEEVYKQRNANNPS